MTDEVLKDVETAIAADLLAAAHALGNPEGELDAANRISEIPHPDWMVLVTAGKLVRTIAGRFGNSPDDPTDDADQADELLDQCQRATWWGRRNKAIKPATADVMSTVVMLARAEDESRVDLAKRWIERNSPFDALHLVHAAAQLVRYVAGPPTLDGRGDDPNRQLDALSVELLESELRKAQ